MIHHHNINAAVGVQRDARRLTLRVVGVVDLLVRLVGVRGLVLFQRQIAAIGGLVENRLLDLLVELLVTHRAKLDEGRNVVPVFLIRLALGVEQPAELIRHLLGDVRGQLLDRAVVLQEGTADVQRQVRAVDNALQKRQEFRNNFLHVVRHEHLTREQLHLTFVLAEVVAEFREIQDALEVEGVVDVQMHPEQRIFPAEHLVIEVDVLLVLTLARLLQPQRFGVVNQARLGFIDDLALLGRAVLVGFAGDFFLALHRLGVCIHQINRIRHVAAVAGQHFADAVEFEELLLFIGDVEDNRRAVRCTVTFADGEVHAILGFPMHRLRTLLTGQRFDFDVLRHHEHAVKAQPEVADNVALLLVALELLHKLGRAGECDLIDIALHLVLGHADAGVADGQGLVLLVHRDHDGHFALVIRIRHTVLRDGVAAVADHLAQENVLIGIQPALNDRHNILGVNRHRALFHFNRHTSFLLGK